jgi:hypothetical protein
MRLVRIIQIVLQYIIKFFFNKWAWITLPLYMIIDIVYWAAILIILFVIKVNPWWLKLVFAGILTVLTWILEFYIDDQVAKRKNR